MVFHVREMRHDSTRRQVCGREAFSSRLRIRQLLEA
jgi:hypothetical protein